MSEIPIMTPERWSRLRALVEDALQRPPDARAEYFAANASDPVMLAEAERMLSFEGEATAMFAIEGWQERVARTSAEQTFNGTVLGSYRLLRELGRGGMGTVYLGERADGVYEQKVAVKVLQENIFSPSLARRFTQERQILAQLQHPGIARLLDGGVVPDGRPYLVLEYVDGQPIDVYCDVHNLDLAARLHLFVRVAEVVQSAHQQLVLHLDLKPANILITPRGEPRLLDFGIARFLSDSGSGSAQTEATLRLLTPRYASPEQAKGAPVGVASDVFSLGTLLYKLVTGRLPYPLEAATPLEAVRMLAEVPPETPSRAAPPAQRVPLQGDLDTIVLQALRKEPERRYPTIAAFADDIQRHLDSQPVHAHADSFRYRAGKFIRRNRMAVAAASLATLVLIGSAVAVVRSAVIARRERNLAERRFKDVQKLAHGYIFELDPQLEGIPGTVKVRSTIMQNALKYLDDMFAERNDDDALMRELGRGYMRIAQLQSHEGLASLSDRAGAMRSLERSYELQKRVLDKNPADLVQRGQVVANLRLMADHERDNGDLKASEAYAKQAWDIGQPILAAGPRVRNFHTMVNVAFTLAQNRGAIEEGPTLGDPEGAVPWLDRVHELATRYASLPVKDQPDPELPLMDIRHELMIRASVFHQLDRDSEARTAYEDALTVSAPLANGGPVARIGVMVLRYTYAGFLLDIHDPQRASEVAPPVVLPTAAETRDADRQQLLQVADILALHARIDLQLRRRASAAHDLVECEALYEKLYAQDSKDGLVNLQMATSYMDVGQEPQLDLATRRRLLLRGLAVLSPQLAASPKGFDELMTDAQGRLRFVDTCKTTVDCPGKDEQLNLATRDLRTVVTDHPNSSEARRMLLRAEQLRSQK